ncbi:MAG: hypothetical protein AB4042_12570 [Leptolyngbyaceae cyanobacterium]
MNKHTCTNGTVTMLPTDQHDAIATANAAANATANLSSKPHSPTTQSSTTTALKPHRWSWRNRALALSILLLLRGGIAV